MRHLFWPPRSRHRADGPYYSICAPARAGQLGTGEYDNQNVRFAPQKRTLVEPIGMSALCQKRTSQHVRAMSALPQKRTSETSLRAAQTAKPSAGTQPTVVGR